MIDYPQYIQGGLTMYQEKLSLLRWKLMYERNPKERYGFPGIYDRITMFFSKYIGYLIAIIITPFLRE